MSAFARLEAMAAKAIRTRPGQMMIRAHGLRMPDPGNHDLNYNRRHSMKQSLYLAGDTVDPSAKVQKRG